MPSGRAGGEPDERGHREYERDAAARGAELSLECRKESGERVRRAEADEHQGEGRRDHHPAVTRSRVQRFIFLAFLAGRAAAAWPVTATTSTSSNKSGSTSRSTPTSVLAGSAPSFRNRCLTSRYAVTRSACMPTM